MKDRTGPARRTHITKDLDYEGLRSRRAHLIQSIYNTQDLCRTYEGTCCFAAALFFALGDRPMASAESFTFGAMARPPRSIKKTY